MIVVRPFECKRTLVFHIINEAHIFIYYLMLLVYLDKSNVERIIFEKHLITVIVSSLTVSAGFNMIDMVINVYKWIRGRFTHLRKVAPALADETGDVTKVVSIKGSEITLNDIKID